MILTLCLAAATVACITNTFFFSDLFSGVRGLLAQRLTGRLALLATCPYCLSHWIAVPVVLLYTWSVRDAAVIYFPVIWLSNHSVAAFNLLGNVVPFLKSLADSQHGLALAANRETPPAESPRADPVGPRRSRVAVGGARRE